MKTRRPSAFRTGALGAAFALASAAIADEAERPPLRCGGAEPDWSLDLREGDAVFYALGEDQIDYALSDERAARGRFWPKAITLTAPTDTAIAILRPAACSDTMSDRKYQWSLDLLTQKDGEAVILTGCCRASPE